MRTNKVVLVLLTVSTVILTILSACSANPVTLCAEFIEISLEQALVPFPNLKVEAYAYDGLIPSEGRNFSPIGLSLEAVMAKRAAERVKPIKQQDAILDGKALTYSYGGIHGNGVVNVKLDGKTIFSSPYGDDSPVDPVRGLWALDGKWILELIHIKTHKKSNTVYTDTRGDVIIDGKSMNEVFGYDESFDFQVLAGKAFYFYKEDGKIGFNFDGQHIQTGFSEISHYACCSGAARNPFHFQNMISLFAIEGEEKLYVEIGVYSIN